MIEFFMLILAIGIFRHESNTINYAVSAIVFVILLSARFIIKAIKENKENE